MRRAFQQFEKQIRFSYESAKSGLNYKALVRQNKVIQGNISIHLNKQNQIPNMLLADLLKQKNFNWIKEEQCMYFDGDFSALQSVEQDDLYHPDSGLLVYDKVKNKLKLHLNRENKSQQGVILGHVTNQQSLYIIHKLRDSNPNCEVIIESSYNFYLKRTFNTLIGISILFLLDGICFSPKNDAPSIFVKNEQQYNKIQS